jgi:hypothetical protein
MKTQIKKLLLITALFIVSSCIAQVGVTPKPHYHKNGVKLGTQPIEMSTDTVNIPSIDGTVSKTALSNINLSQFNNNGNGNGYPFITEADYLESEEQRLDVGVRHLVNLDFEVTANSFPAGGQWWSAPVTVSTLEPADATFDRIDLFAAKTDGVVGEVTRITGVASANPLEPNYDSDTEYPIRFILVKANATTPEGYTEEQVFNEGVGEPTEWTFVPEGTAVLVGTDATVGSSCIEATDESTSNFINDTAIGTEVLSTISFDIKLKSALGSSKLRLYFYRHTPFTKVWTVYLPKTAIDSTNSDWQSVVFNAELSSIPFDTFDGFGVIMENSVGLGYKIDNVKFQYNTEIFNVGSTPKLTKTSQLENTGANDDSTYVEHDEIDTFSKLNAIVTDKSLVNLEDDQSFGGIQYFTNGLEINADKKLILDKNGDEWAFILHDELDVFGFNNGMIFAAAGGSHHFIEGETEDYVPIFSSGYNVDGKTNTDVLLAGGGTTLLSGLLTPTDINTFAKLDAIVADKSLVNLQDAQTFTEKISFAKEVVAINEVTDTNAIFDFANFAQQGLGGEPTGFVFHHYTDGHQMQVDNVGIGDILRLVNAQNATRRSDEASDYVGTGNFLKLITTPSGVASGQETLMYIDKDGFYQYPRATDYYKIILNKADDANYAFQFMLNNDNTNLVNFDEKFKIQTESATNNTFVSDRGTRFYVDGSVNVLTLGASKIDTSKPVYFGNGESRVLSGTSLSIRDGAVLKIGDGNDWQMNHDGADNNIDLYNGDLVIRQNTAEQIRFERATGEITSNGYNVDGKTDADVVLAGGGTTPLVVDTSALTNDGADGDSPFIMIKDLEAVNHTYFVDNVNGVNATGVKGQRDFPFLTVDYVFSVLTGDGLDASPINIIELVNEGTYPVLTQMPVINVSIRSEYKVTLDYTGAVLLLGGDNSQGNTFEVIMPNGHLKYDSTLNQDYDRLRNLKINVKTLTTSTVNGDLFSWLLGQTSITCDILGLYSESLTANVNNSKINIDSVVIYDGGAKMISKGNSLGSTYNIGSISGTGDFTLVGGTNIVNIRGNITITGVTYLQDHITDGSIINFNNCEITNGVKTSIWNWADITLTGILKVNGSWTAAEDTNGKTLTMKNLNLTIGGGINIRNSHIAFEGTCITTTPADILTQSSAADAETKTFTVKGIATFVSQSGTGNLISTQAARPYNLDLTEGIIIFNSPNYGTDVTNVLGDDFAFSPNVPVGGGTSNPNIFIATLATDFTSPDVANQNKIWELQTDIDLGNAVVDLSSYNITFKDGGGQLTNFTSIDLGDFKVDNGEDAVLFDQSGTIAGEVSGLTYVGWFGLNANASLISGATLNGALPDHIAIQNAQAVTKLNNGTISFPYNAYMMQGDGTNPDYTYVDNPYTGAGNVIPDLAQDDEIGTLQGFFFEDYVDLTILGNGARIIANPNQTCIVNNKGFQFLNSNNVYIENLSYDGNIVQRDPFLIDYNPYHAQHGFGFDGCFNPILKNITSDNTVMDGFYFGADSGGQGAGYGGSMTNCRANYNYRQGMSVVSHSSLKVYDSHFSFTGKAVSLVDGRWLTTSPSAGVDMEAGGVDTAPNLRGQYDMLFQACTFESNNGSGLAVHWGSTRTNVIACTFINNSLFEPQDSVEETTGNNTYENNTFLNSVARLEAGGVHFTGNRFLFDDYPTTNGLNPPSVESNASQAITALDSGNYYADGFHRQSIIKDNLIKIEAENANFATTDLTVGRVTVNIENVKFDGNRIVNALGITSGGGVATMVDIGNVKPAESVDNNEWIFTAAALAKYTGNIGRFTIERENGSFNNNKVDDGYASLSGLPLGGSFAAVELRGSYAKFSSAGGPIDGDEAWEIHVPNINGDLKVTTVNSTSQGGGITETWLSTYDVTHRETGYTHGTSKSAWYFSDPQVDTNPNSGNASYMIVARHDSAGNTNLETQIIIEWFGQNGEVNKANDFFCNRNGASIPAGTFRKVYDGNGVGTTANIPTTGGLDNYTAIKIGADYYDTTTNSMKHWDGSSFN